MFDRNLMRLPGMPAIMGALLLLALLQAAAIAGQAMSLGNAIALLWEGSPLDDVVSFIAGFAACFAVLQILRFAQETMLDRFSLKQAACLQAEILDKTFDADTLLAHRAGTANVATTATEGIDEIQTYIHIIPPKIVGMMAISIPLLVVVFLFDWPSGVILMVMFPVIIFFMVLLGRQARDRAERQYAAYTRLSNRFLDTLRGLGVIKAFGASRAEGSATYEYSEKLRRATVRTLTTATLSSAVLDLCATFGVAAVAMMLAFRLMDGSVSLYTGLVALMLSPEYFTPIRSFASDFHASLDGKNALAAVLEMTSGGAPSKESSDLRQDDSAKASETTKPAPWSSESTLEFKNVSFSYDDAESGVRNLSFKLHGNEKVGVVGKSGAGKTTLVKLVAGFLRPTEGEVLVDGVPADLTSASWKSQVRVIPQSPYVFRTTLADNIRFYNPNASDDQVVQAAQAVGLDEFVRELPDGYDTLVGEGARGLSGGQAHRIALARVLLDANARVLVFDEPTAHLDIETELELKERMLPLMDGKLVLFATHRLHWVDQMNRTIELSDGSVTRIVSSEEVAR